MTPPAAPTTPRTARPTSRRRPAQRPPRRVSGPARGARAATAAPVPRGGAVAVTPPLGLRVARAGGRIVDARFLDRLLRGRVWIGLLAVGLMGIVFIQVSMLRLNAGISRAITSAETLSHQNASLRADISKLDSGERLADSAAALGMVQPAPGSVNYLDARKGNARAAAQAIRPPRKDATSTGASTSGATTQSAATASAAPATAVQPQAQAASAAPAATTATTQTPSATAQAPATTTAATTVPAQTTPPAQTQQAAPAQTQPAAPTQTQAAPTQTQTQPTATAQSQPAPVTAAGGTGVTGQGGQ
jgi:hypothetical protein